MLAEAETLRAVGKGLRGDAPVRCFAPTNGNTGTLLQLVVVELLGHKTGPRDIFGGNSIFPTE